LCLRTFPSMDGTMAIGIVAPPGQV
jgi:hypothetical protein